MAARDTVTVDRNATPRFETLRVQHNLTVADMFYHMMNYIIASAAIAIATTTTKIKTVTNPIAYVSNGIFKSLAATDNFWTLAGTTLPTGFSCKFLLLVNAAGTASVMQSTFAATAAGCVFAQGLPAAGLVIVGIVQLDNASGADFVPGTTALTGVSGLTVTYFNGTDASTFQGASAILT